MTRLAWSYWHLKKVKECEETVKSMLSQNGEIKTTREVKVLQRMIHKAKLGKTNNVQEKGSDEDEIQGGVLAKLDINFDKSKGRYLTAKEFMTSSNNVINEKAYCGILNQKYQKTHCNLCFKDCRISGVPCFGCTHVMYCSDICRNKAWVMHHWLECCMWPVIYKSEAFAQMALRMILHGAYELYTAKFDKEQCLISGHTCSSIASHIKNSCITSKTNTTAKHKKKQSASQTTAVTGLNPVDNKYYGKYWSVYCLQTHFSDHGKARISKCESTARFLATVVEQCLAIPQPSPSKSKHATNIESLLNQVFGNLSFPAMHENTDSMFDIEDLRNQVKSVCEKFGKLVPDKNAKQQTYSVSKGKHSLNWYKPDVM
uniref:SET and MYND domain-containing protein 4-like n=1 Tax=Phallusia mammillata TaxID=59560 RepID=A0A6F9DSI8_9ASCI|nr:SET and MYND domain-containing protein 4-like [Phallusia mammillata]